jgi:hypothetical protein
MAEKKQPEKKPLTPAQQSMRTLGLFLLVFLGPLIALRVACVTPREACEHGGGRYGQTPNVNVCTMPSGQSCPPTYRWSEHGEGCVSRVSALPGMWRWTTW